MSLEGRHNVSDKDAVIPEGRKRKHCTDPKEEIISIQSGRRQRLDNSTVVGRKRTSSYRANAEEELLFERRKRQRSVLKKNHRDEEDAYSMNTEGNRNGNSDKDKNINIDAVANGGADGGGGCSNGKSSKSGNFGSATSSMDKHPTANIEKQKCPISLAQPQTHSKPTPTFQQNQPHQQRNQKQKDQNTTENGIHPHDNLKSSFLSAQTGAKQRTAFNADNRSNSSSKILNRSTPTPKTAPKTTFQIAPIFTFLFSWLFLSLVFISLLFVSYQSHNQHLWQLHDSLTQNRQQQHRFRHWKHFLQRFQQFQIEKHRRQLQSQLQTTRTQLYNFQYASQQRSERHQRTLHDLHHKLRHLRDVIQEERSRRQPFPSYQRYHNDTNTNKQFHNDHPEMGSMTLALNEAWMHINNLVSDKHTLKANLTILQRKLAMSENIQASLNDDLQELLLQKHALQQSNMELQSSIKRLNQRTLIPSQHQQQIQSSFDTPHHNTQTVFEYSKQQQQQQQQCQLQYTRLKQIHRRDQTIMAELDDTHFQFYLELENMKRILNQQAQSSIAAINAVATSSALSKANDLDIRTLQQKRDRYFVTLEAAAAMNAVLTEQLKRSGIWIKNTVREIF